MTQNIADNLFKWSASYNCLPRNIHPDFVSLIIGTGYWVHVFAWSSVAQSVCQQAFSLLEIRFHRPGSNPAFSGGRQLVFFRFACLCNNKHVYHQSHVRKLTDSGVEWAECSLIIGTGYWVQVFAWSSTAHFVGGHSVCYEQRSIHIHEDVLFLIFEAVNRMPGQTGKNKGLFPTWKPDLLLIYT